MVVVVVVVVVVVQVVVRGTATDLTNYNLVVSTWSELSRVIS